MPARSRIGVSKSRTLEVSMRQLEMLMVQVWLRAKEDPNSASVTWNELPERVRVELIKQLAEMLRAKLERSTAGVVGDE
jgi:hypothetical protein